MKPKGTRGVQAIGRSLAKTLLPLAAALALSTASTAGVRIELTAVPELPRDAQGESIVRAVLGFAARQPQDATEAAYLKAAERSFEAVLIPRPGPVVGMTTVKNEGDDVLIAQWQPGQPAATGVEGFWVWDAPDYSWFVLKCDPANFKSPASAQDFLGRILKWETGAPDPLRMNLRYAASEVGDFLDGTADLWLVGSGTKYRVLGVRSGPDSYLLVQVWKELFRLGYPEGGVYVPERFPPLKELVKGWSKERILSEVGRLWDRSDWFANIAIRDQILIAESARRGLGRSDLELLFFPSNVPGFRAWSWRTGSVMTALVHTNQVDGNREAIADIAMKLGTRDDIGRFALQNIFDGLSQSKGDFTGLALECLSKCVNVEPPLSYLRKRGNTEDVYAKVKRAVVVDLVQEAQRDAALAEIRARIDEAKAPR